MHTWPEAGYLETSDGNLMVTRLLNFDMPLVRYQVGDRASLDTGNAACPCGRGLPAFGRIEGRTDDVLYSADGRQVGRLDPLFKGDSPILEAQIIQESRRRVRLLYVPAPEFQPGSAAQLRRLLEERLGPMEFELAAVNAIPRRANGKFRAVVNRMGKTGHE
jgi:phenylacetate-CoA ligase